MAIKKTTCIYLESDDQYLMMLRNKKHHDENEGKWIGIGGKLECNETLEECAIREVYEETGYKLQTKQLLYKGLVHFNVNDIETETISIYIAQVPYFEPIDCIEGTLKWINKEDILNLSLWEGDRLFLKELILNKRETFCFSLYYDRKGNLKDWRNELCRNL